MLKYAPCSVLIVRGMACLTCLRSRSAAWRQPSVSRPHHEPSGTLSGRCAAPDHSRRAEQPAGPAPHPLVSRFVRQFTHFLALLLWVAAGLAFLADVLHQGQGMATLGWAILGVILINAVFAFLQEYKAERAVQALRGMLPAKAWVIRDGQQQQIARSELVPGRARAGRR